MPEIWARGGHRQGHHHCVVINVDGKRLLSRRVQNDESEMLRLIGDVLEISADALWPASAVTSGCCGLARRSPWTCAP